MAFSPDGQRLVSASADQTARVWDVKTGREMLRFRGHGQVVHQAKFSPDGRRIASASDDKTVKVWDADTGDVILTLRGHTGPIESVAFSRDGRRIASGSVDGTVKIWDAASGEELLTLRGPEGEVFSVVFGPEDQWLASSSPTDRDHPPVGGDAADSGTAAPARSRRPGERPPHRPGIPRTRSWTICVPSPRSANRCGSSP